MGRGYGVVLQKSQTMSFYMQTLMHRDTSAVCSLPLTHSHSCMHTHTYKCTHAHTHTYKHTHMHTHKHTHAHTHTHKNMHAHTHTRAHTHTQTHICTHTCTYTNTHTHTCIHMCTHTCTHMHKHTHTNTIRFLEVEGTGFQSRLAGSHMTWSCRELTAARASKAFFVSGAPMAFTGVFTIS